MAVIEVKFGGRNRGRDRKRSARNVVIKPLLMVHKVVGVSRSDRVISDPRIQPCCARHLPVIPHPPSALRVGLKVVVDHVAIDRVRSRRTIKPPDFVEALVSARKHLLELQGIDVFKDIAADIAVKRLRAAIVHIELVFTHPVRHTVRKGHRVLACD